MELELDCLTSRIHFQKSSTCNSKLKFTELKKFIHQKGPEKLVKDKLSAITKFQIFGGKISLQILGFSFVKFILLLLTLNNIAHCVKG